MPRCDAGFDGAQPGVSALPSPTNESALPDARLIQIEYIHPESVRQAQSALGADQPIPRLSQSTNCVSGRGRTVAVDRTARRQVSITSGRRVR